MGKGGYQPAEAEDVVKVRVGEQDFIEPLEADAAAEKLALRAFAAVDQEAIFIVLNNLCGKSALCRRGGRGGAKKKYFKQS